MKTEPTSEMRQAASAVWQMFVALVDEGFTQEQALKLVSGILTQPRGD